MVPIGGPIASLATTGLEPNVPPSTTILDIYYIKKYKNKFIKKIFFSIYMLENAFFVELGRPLMKEACEMRESSIEKAVGLKVKRLGGLSVKLSPAGLSGLPDRLMLLPGGKMCFVEFKKKGEKPRRLQVYRVEQLRALGFNVFIVDDTEGLDGFLGS